MYLSCTESEPEEGQPKRPAVSQTTFPLKSKMATKQHLTCVLNLNVTPYRTGLKRKILAPVSRSEMQVGTVGSKHLKCLLKEKEEILNY